MMRLRRPRAAPGAPPGGWCRAVGGGVGDISPKQASPGERLLPAPLESIFPFPADLGLPWAAEQEWWGGPRRGCLLGQTAGLRASES